MTENITMKLVIVESPAKAKTIQKYLGSDFIVKSSYGHVRDLPKAKLGVNTEDGFEPQYIIPLKAKKNVSELKKAAGKAEEIYFATDEDREGEAIAWHLSEIIKADPAKCKRITFDEITKTAIQQAIQNPRAIDINLVNAQQARRVLDRLVGYELSPLLWRKVRRGLSAGRVQSVAVRLIVEREEEIAAFKPEEYWSLTAHLMKDSVAFPATLAEKDGKKIARKDIKNKEETDKIVQALTSATYQVGEVTQTAKKRVPPPPFTTSTLQQAAVNQLGFSSKATMRIAQQLYEGIDLGQEGPIGLITYMRTDSVNLAKEALAVANQVIKKHFGDEYALAEPRFYKTKSKGAQEAHEAIRPTDPTRTPDAVASFLDGRQLKLYRLIWQRMIASQMAAARLNTVSAMIATSTPYRFKAVGTTVEFEGYTKVYGGKNDFLQETLIPSLKTADKLALEKLETAQHFTQPPARYSEATLVKALEQNGIGRPSTYAPTIDTVQRREYVVKGEDKKFSPTEVGQIVTNLLKEHFTNIVDVDFTAKVEEELDEIASGGKEWQPMIKEFYEPFHKNIEIKNAQLSKKELTQEKTGENCPKCGHEMVIKLGRFGRFKACSNFPECKHTEPTGEDKELAEKASGEKCPECGKPLVLKRGRFGPFLGCSGYPECKHIKKIEKTTGVKCPKCEIGEIVEKRSKRGKTFYSCNKYPECKNAYWSKPTGEKCPTCGSLLVYGAKNTVRCSSKECGYTREAGENGKTSEVE